MHPRLLVLSTVVLGVIAVAAWVGPPQAANAVTNQPTSSLPAFAQLTWNGTAFSGDTSLASIGGVDVSTDHVELCCRELGNPARITARARAAAARTEFTTTQ